jgi:chitin deacetylase
MVTIFLAWAQGFPNSYNVPDPTQMPQAWIDAYNAAVAAGTIPNIPPSTNTPNGNPTYPAGLSATGPQVCSSTYQCRMPDDIWDAPAGVLGIGFDDGPYPVGVLFSPSFFLAA